MGKSNSTFRFKQFAVDHSQSSMKVGTDGVLIGAWCDVQESKRILDVGTGSGLIALMLAQRTGPDVVIDAVDIDPVDAAQALENVNHSPWHERIRVHTSPIQNWNPDYRYDIIVSNPPFFINSFEPPDLKRTRSRHTVTLSHEELLRSSLFLLNAKGRINVILPAAEGVQFLKLAESYGLSCSRLFSFRPRNNKPVERWLIELTVDSITMTKGEIIMYGDGNEWTDGYKNLTREFYLKI